MNDITVAISCASVLSSAGFFVSTALLGRFGIPVVIPAFLFCFSFMTDIVRGDVRSPVQTRPLTRAFLCVLASLGTKLLWAHLPLVSEQAAIHIQASSLLFFLALYRSYAVMFLTMPLTDTSSPSLLDVVLLSHHLAKAMFFLVLAVDYFLDVIRLSPSLNAVAESVRVIVPFLVLVRGGTAVGMWAVEWVAPEAKDELVMIDSEIDALVSETTKLLAVRAGVDDIEKGKC
ncbi:hypothetical protein HDU98_010873 [Podochytrium sp. JEL0797]|nr:hypothetical protein HDU98_010873 [Podochytrium sp. JEL0797]